jgi:hypothetical protein
LTFASATARVFDGFDTTRATSGVGKFAIASLFPVASSAISSSGPQAGGPTLSKSSRTGRR